MNELDMNGLNVNGLNMNELDMNGLKCKDRDYLDVCIDFNYKDIQCLDVFMD